MAAAAVRIVVDPDVPRAELPWADLRTDAVEPLKTGEGRRDRSVSLGRSLDHEADGRAASAVPWRNVDGARGHDDHGIEQHLEHDLVARTRERVADREPARGARRR